MMQTYLQIITSYPVMLQTHNGTKENHFNSLIRTAKEEEKLGYFANDAMMRQSRTFKAVRNMDKTEICSLVDHVYSEHRVARNTKYDALTIQRDLISERGYGSIIKDFYLIGKYPGEIRRAAGYNIFDLKFVAENIRYNGSEKMIIALLLMAQETCSPAYSKQDPTLLINDLAKKYGLAPAPQRQIMDGLLFAAYHPETKTILLPANHSRADIVHEFGHFLFIEREFSEEFEEEINNLFIGSKGKDRDGVPFWEAVDDSNYVCGPDAHGHPDSNIDEFFASTFMVFELYKEEFRENIRKKEDLALARWAAQLEALFEKELTLRK